MRELMEHKCSPANDRLRVAAVDGPGPGGANHLYRIMVPDVGKDHPEIVTIRFQQGGIAEVGVNGLTHEVLLAIVADRLRGFQAGPFACRDNDMALAAVESALAFLHKRTIERMQRGVEGKLKV